MFKYEEVTALIRKDIIDGIYPNNKLPTKIELTKIFNVSMITINKVLEELNAEGIIEIKQGSGIFIKNVNNYLLHSKYESQMHGFKMNSRHLDYQNYINKFKIIKATEFLSENLNIKVGTEVYEIIRSRIVNDKITQYERTYMPVSLFPDLKQKHILDSLYNYILNDCNYKIDYTHDLISCKNADDIDKYYLQLEHSTALGTLEQIGYLTNGLIFQYTSCVFLPESFYFKHINSF